ncbi:hypothetical protein Bbelb_299170 [Branchiostoma belcheri]|nr:hypothetical protein Bbelb_299170 [Branchiostoma belcheri]
MAARKSPALRFISTFHHITKLAGCSFVTGLGNSGDPSFDPEDQQKQGAVHADAGCSYLPRQCRLVHPLGSYTVDHLLSPLFELQHSKAKILKTDRSRGLYTLMLGVPIYLDNADSSTH